MSQTKQASQRKRRRKVVIALGAAGLSLSWLVIQKRTGAELQSGRVAVRSQLAVSFDRARLGRQAERSFALSARAAGRRREREASFAWSVASPHRTRLPTLALANTQLDSQSAAERAAFLDMSYRHIGKRRAPSRPSPSSRSRQQHRPQDQGHG
jgi:hypothetical protein